MATLTIAFIPLATPPSAGYVVTYRIRGSSGAYTTVLPAPTTSPVVITGLATSTEYEGTIGAHCDTEFGVIVNFITCTCPSGFSVIGNNVFCQKIEYVTPTVTHSGYCLAPSTNNVYTQLETRIYNPGFSYSSINSFTPPSGDIYAILTTPTIWKNSLGNSSDGPMNKCAVWIDSDCNGIKDSLSVGTQTTLAAIFNNFGISRTIYIGIGGDNQFVLKVNSIIIANSPITLDGSHNGDRNFKCWHIFPVTVVPGINDINVVGTGDGSSVDSIGMTIYDNTAPQLLAAITNTDLNIAFSSESLRGNHIDIATCAAGYSLDTSGGSGFYTCRKITDAPCGGA